jgi:hypothetical protein
MSDPESNSVDGCSGAYPKISLQSGFEITLLLPKVAYPHILTCLHVIGYDLGAYLANAEQALELLTRGSDVPPREKELIKSIPEMEAINMMVGNVRLSVPGLQKLKTEQRRQK